jgi:hypothetical protein
MTHVVNPLRYLRACLARKKFNFWREVELLKRPCGKIKGRVMNQKETSIHCERHTERGQSIAIIALALVGLLAFVGIAVDVGFVFARSSQLQAAVDAAALAAVPELGTSGGLGAADLRAGQFLNANNIPISVTQSLQSSMEETAITELQYSLTVTWPIDLFFLNLVGLENYDLRRSATAAYLPQADIYASRRVDQGIVNTSNQAVFGPSACTSMGDPFSPINSAWAPGLYTYKYRILLPADYPSDVLRVELFDPDSINSPDNSAQVVFSNVAQASNPSTFPAAPQTMNCTGDNARQVNPCLIPTGETSLISGSTGITIDQINPWWIVRIDENRHNCNTPTSYMPTSNTRTLYQLFYYRQNEDGTLERIDLATYTGQIGTTDGGSHDTDLRWVSPGGQQSFDQPVFVPVDPGSAKTFELNIAQDLTNILTDPANGNRYVYLDVTAIEGHSENGFEVWAGPPDYINSVPSEVNARNLYVLNNAGSHYSRGATVFGMGRLPMNSNFANRVNIPLMYVGPEMAGQNIFIRVFDPDSGARPPIIFYFDSIAFTPNDTATDGVNWASTDWAMSYGGGNDPAHGCFRGGSSYNGACNNQWVTYQIVVPGDPDNCYVHPTRGQQCISFYGGRFSVRYQGGNHDTYSWQINIEGNPYLVR